jgi:hypothetical protein
VFFVVQKKNGNRLQGVLCCHGGGVPVFTVQRTDMLVSGQQDIVSKYMVVFSAHNYTSG